MGADRVVYKPLVLVGVAPKLIVVEQSQWQNSPDSGSLCKLVPFYHSVLGIRGHIESGKSILSQHRLPS
jgi:hypothetical protein